MEEKTLTDWQQRVIDESKDLSIKISKLEEFIQESVMFKKLSVGEQVRLILQLKFMEQYWRVLLDRIKAFE